MSRNLTPKLQANREEQESKNPNGAHDDVDSRVIVGTYCEDQPDPGYRHGREDAADRERQVVGQDTVEDGGGDYPC